MPGVHVAFVSVDDICSSGGIGTILPGRVCGRSKVVRMHAFHYVESRKGTLAQSSLQP